MAKPRTNELVNGRYFVWKLLLRDGVYYADGRANTVNVGRHSLHERDRQSAINRLEQLDLAKAIECGLAVPPSGPVVQLLSLTEGRELYDAWTKRPFVVGGVKKSTQKRYKAVFDKFLPFVQGLKILSWNEITNQVLNKYATHLDTLDYHGKTIRNELTTIVQAQKWLIDEGHLVGVEPAKLKMRRVESRKAYCYRQVEVEAMIAHCRTAPDLEWLAGIIVGLACTGLRISELAALRWTDIDFGKGTLTLTDESAVAKRGKQETRELKSHRGRWLPIHPDLSAVLKDLPRSDRLVFRGPRGGRVKPDTIRNILVREVIKPLLPQFRDSDVSSEFERGRLHSFRHYFASTCANRGVPERVVMSWLGHQDSEMVRHYYHLHDEESRRQMANLDLIGNKTGKQSPGIRNGTASNRTEELPSRGEKPESDKAS